MQDDGLSVQKLTSRENDSSARRWLRYTKHLRSRENVSASRWPININTYTRELTMREKTKVLSDRLRGNRVRARADGLRTQHGQHAQTHDGVPPIGESGKAYQNCFGPKHDSSIILRERLHRCLTTRTDHRYSQIMI